MGKSKTLKDGKRVGLTRNQRRKAEYATLAHGRSSSSAPSSTGQAKKRKINHHKNILRQAREQRHIEADARKTKSNTLSPKQRLHLLDERLGKGVGATRERARLIEQIKNPPKPEEKK
jgi:hypothetical protein